jgi:predicted glycosyltransferase involved in capsule biosynthesis
MDKFDCDGLTSGYLRYLLTYSIFDKVAKHYTNKFMKSAGNLEHFRGHGAIKVKLIAGGNLSYPYTITAQDNVVWEKDNGVYMNNRFTYSVNP